MGIVPGKMENRDEVITKTAELPEDYAGSGRKKLAAKWVREDSFRSAENGSLVWKRPSC